MFILVAHFYKSEIGNCCENTDVSEVTSTSNFVVLTKHLKDPVFGTNNCQ
jgi:hypothetical protein